MAKGSYKGSRICDSVPADIARNVGRLTIKWASFEYRVQIIIWELAGLGEATGRIIVREPRIADRLAMLNHLAQKRGLKIDTKIFKDIVESAKSIEQNRDMLSHSPWVEENGELKIISFRGKIADQSLEDQSRRVNPEGFRVTASFIAEMIAALDNLIDFTRSCMSNVEKLKS